MEANSLKETSIIPVSLPWSIQEWTKTNVSKITEDWRFFVFVDAWKEAIFKNERAKGYLDLIMLPETTLPSSLQEILQNESRFERLIKQSHKRLISEQEIERILLNAQNLAGKKPPFFPCSALNFECLVVASDFCDSTAKKLRIKKSKDLKYLEETIRGATILYAIVAVNEHFGLSKELRQRLPRGRIPTPPGRKGFSHHCPLCKKPTVQTVLFSYVNHLVDAEISTEYTLTECARCHEPGLFMREDEGFGFLPKTEYHLWRGDSRTNHGILPSEVARHYSRAADYEKECKWDAAVLEVGRTLEAIVKHFAGKSRNLGDGLRHLNEQKIITADLYEWANELRVLRNLSAHASGKSFTEWEANTAFDFLDAIVETVFWTRSRFEQFKKKSSCQ